MELIYEQIKSLKSLSSDIIAKQNTISDIDKMIENLTAKPEFGSAYLRSCQITVGDRKLGLSEQENVHILHKKLAKEKKRSYRLLLLEKTPMKNRR